MTPRIQTVQSQLRDWRRLLVWWLWLSVAVCMFAAILVAQAGEGEGTKLAAAALLGFAMLGVAFIRALRNIDQPRWWHWALGMVLLAPAVIAVASISAGV
jgi:hypothetical protein